MSVGILGIGTYLPPEIRRNDWWSREVVASWRQRGAPPPMPQPTTAAMGAVIKAIKEQAADPFRGVTQRHVLDANETSSDMEVRAASQAIDRAAIAPAHIDLLMVHTAVPEYLLANPAAIVHHRLGLRSSCLSIEVAASAYSFLAQLALAVPMIESGRVRHALLVQSSAASRLIDPNDPVSVALGDAATAVVLGNVTEGRGVLSAVHRTDGTCPNSLVASVPGARWYDGRTVLHVANQLGERQLFLETVDQGKQVITDALAAADIRPESVDFFAVHQGTAWLRRLTQEHARISQARSIDLFPETAYVFAASLPLVLAVGEQRGLLAPDDLVLAFGGGTGISVGATLLRWGR